MNKLQLHKKIRETLKESPDKITKDDVFVLINGDKNYFFDRANANWVEWLWENNFLDVFKKETLDKSGYSYRTPEIAYLEKVAEIKPEFVVNTIILDDDVATHKDKYSLELIDRFLSICSKFPPELLVKVFPKIKTQEWLKVMSPFQSWGFEYEKMFKTLYEAKNIEGLIELVEIILTVRNKDEIKKEYSETGGRRFLLNESSPFYIGDLSNTKVFEYLEKIEEKQNKEKVLKLLIETIKNTIKLGGINEDSIFKFDDNFHLYDINLFEFDSYIRKRRKSYKEDKKEIVVIALKVLNDLILDNCESQAKDIFNKYIGHFYDKNSYLPDVKTVWKMRLIVMSLCPETFKDDIEKYIFRFIDAGDKYYDVSSGAEFEIFLRDNFKFLSDNKQKEFINKIFEKNKLDDEKSKDEKRLAKMLSGRIFVLIKDSLSPEEKKEIKKLLNLDVDIEKYKPSSRITYNDDFARTIESKGLVGKEEFDKMSIDEIIGKLKNEWTPENLHNKNDIKNGFHNPINADGTGGLIENGVLRRFELFIENSEKFFDKDNVSSHYTYSFLRGVQEALRQHKIVKDSEWKSLISVLKNIVRADLKNESEKKTERYYDTWIASWKSVYYAMTDVLEGLLRDDENKNIIIGNFELYRNDILEILKYLSQYPDPNFKDEIKETAGSTSSNQDGSMSITDPNSMAINSVRGRAFQAFLLFVYQDGKELKDEDIKIKKDVKNFYESVLKSEDTRAMMFMHGYHLPTFHYRDKKWVISLLPKVFPENDKEMFLASTEGYLSQTIYKEMFEDESFKKMYEKWIDLKETKYSNNQNNFKEINESLAIHLALAFLYFDVDMEEFEIKNSLFYKFWNVDNKNNEIRYSEFINFVGRQAISSGVEDITNVVKLEAFWKFVLSKENIPEKSFSAFGFWINKEQEVLKDSLVIDLFSETLEKSDGDINWDYGFLKKLPDFAGVNSEKTISMIKRYFIDKKGGANQHRRMPIYDINGRVRQALENIYKEGDNQIKEKVKNLINELLETGELSFWAFESIIYEQE